MASKYMKRCSALLLIGKRKLKLQEKNITHPLRMTKIKNKNKLTIPSTGEYVKQWEFPMLLVGMSNGVTTLKNT